MFRICQIKYQKPAFHGQAVKTVAYLRVSTAQQDVRSQRLAILEYARKARLPHRQLHRGDRLRTGPRKAPPAR